MKRWSAAGILVLTAMGNSSPTGTAQDLATPPLEVFPMTERVLYDPGDQFEAPLPDRYRIEYAMDWSARA